MIKMNKDYFYHKINDINKQIELINKCKKNDEIKNIYKQIINEYNNILSNINVSNYLYIPSKIQNLDTYLTNYKEPLKNYDLEISYNDILNVYLNFSIIYKQFSFIEEKRELKIEYLEKCLNLLKETLQINMNNDTIQMEIVSIYSILCDVVKDTEKCIELLNNSLIFIKPNNSFLIHYNLGFLYSKLNSIDKAITHYKNSIYICKVEKNKNTNNNLFNTIFANSINNISSLYRSLKCWNESVYYLSLGINNLNNDPDLLNHLGIIFTEMRRTDLSEECFTRAYENVDKSFISNDKNKLKSEILLNWGHMESYNGNNTGSIEKYNKSLEIYPIIYSFQNKLMNLNYLYFDLNDPLKYIYDQHNLINNFYKKHLNLQKNYFKFNKKNSSLINIGFISGDFVEHPVSFFISYLIQNLSKHYINNKKINVICYSQSFIDLNKYNINATIKFISNLTSIDAANLIYNDNIDILFDLSGHTSNNRLDIFYLKPSPVQVSYCGYANTTGLSTIDYRLTDKICDNSLSQKFHSEKLIYLKNCFLCYNPNPYKLDFKPLELSTQPFLYNKYITIGCFNRVNKISKEYILLCNKLLNNTKYPIKFIFKTKALLNEKTKKSFVNNFVKPECIEILDCSFSHTDHLLIYNKLDFSLDTFPYSGTTTSCESLLMGVPVITLKDNNDTPLHSHNVTSSILINSNLSEYVFKNYNDIIKFIEISFLKNKLYWKLLKQNTRERFLNGKVCDNKSFINNFVDILHKIYKN